MLGLPLSQGFNNLDFDKIIHPSRNIVNQKIVLQLTKSQELFSVLGLQSPQGFNNLDFDKIIHPGRNIVNQKFDKTGEGKSNTMEQEKIQKESIENEKPRTV